MADLHRYWVLRFTIPLSIVLATNGMAALAAEQIARPSERITFGPNDTQRCLKCHGMPNFAFRDSATLAIHSFTVNVDTFRVSVHARINCQQCHTNIKEYPHGLEGTRALVSCGADCHASDSSGKSYDHQRVLQEFSGSVHRRGLTGENKDDPVCTTCHGRGNPHAIARAKKAISAKQRMQLCISCHDDAALALRNKLDRDAVSSYRRSFHYKAIHFGQENTAVCQDCHTVHRILPKDSTASSIAAGNIAGTCGTEHCHPGAKMNFAMSGANHLALRIEHEPLLWWLERSFIVLTLGTMAMLVVGIILDVQRKFGWGIVLGKAVRHVRRGTYVGGDSFAKLLRFSRRILFD